MKGSIQKRPLNIGSIQSSPRDKEYLNETKVVSKVAQGTVKFFHRKKGYGFVAGENGKDAFIHYSNIAMEGSRFLETGDIVEYEELQGDSEGMTLTDLKTGGYNERKRCILPLKKRVRVY